MRSSYSRKSVVSRQAFRKATQRSPIFSGAVESGQSLTLLSDPEVSQFSQGRLRNSPKSRSQLLRILYHNQLIYFNPANKYLTGPEQLWLIESLIGTQILNKALSLGKLIDNRFIESLFKKATFTFFLSADKAYLVSSDDELTQLDFGPLTKISALTALQQFGVTTLERVKEKTAVRL
ncbi:hypothetical protein GO755_23150 [Spirosoma sp. HMF4905]|uniref:Uncharacterized protein n=1 Tax=Spirosoma arboris TaxID=2682092 RepID=A0A7K1SGL8_9BACT|nr:hypothetical protein [Spirosoma arboris]MVM32957.1 hypothetical protein [Spirosoma arboris]